ncbi:winged helix-turn-helix transcriptional regulator [Thermoleophilum album]|uniref:Two-component system, OmpR family, phosphate regulon response regulator PhoB n=1 Tax=Thermoleophilum album TaxID=29539 RepID=A0A1H6G0K5_THEAL|nr:response regulator transcription factor [Thermoleophilum album]SEH15435.1 two-component system, OmpR family, phosphate regulon response regulator PhoB [Thermoleophilum album]
MAPGEAWLHAPRSDERELLVAALAAFGYQSRPLIAAGFAVLSGANRVVGVPSTSPARSVAGRSPLPALVVVAVESGADLSERLRRTVKLLRQRGVATVAVTDPLTDDELAHEADELVVRPFGPAELELRVARALQGAPGESRARSGEGAATQEVRLGPVVLDLEERRCTVEGREVPLTKLEFELLAHLLTNPRRVHTRSALLTTVWGYHEPAGERAVDVCVLRLRKKLGPVGCQLIETVRGVGYRAAPALVAAARRHHTARSGRRPLVAAAHAGFTVL